MFANGDWTWDTLYEFAKEINTDDNNDGTPEIYGHIMEWSSLPYYIASTGTDIIRFGGDNGKISYNLENANVTKALNFVKKLYTLANHSAPWDGMKEVIAGKAGFYFGNAWHMKDSDAAIKAHKNGQIAYVPLPRANGTNTYYINAGVNTAWFIPKGAKNPYLAAAYLYYQQYLGFNPNKTMQQEQLDNLKAWGYTDTEIKYMTASFTKVQPKPVFSGIGERIDGYDFNTLHLALRDPNQTVAQAVATVAPTLKAAINRFNNAH